MSGQEQDLSKKHGSLGHALGNQFSDISTEVEDQTTLTAAGSRPQVCGILIVGTHTRVRQAGSGPPASQAKKGA